MGHAGISQLHIGNVALPVQIQNAGIIQLHPVGVLVQPLPRHQTGIGFHHHGLSGNAVVISVAADAPGTVAAHFATGAVGIVKMKPKIGFLGIIHCHKAIGVGKFT